MKQQLKALAPAWLISLYHRSWAWMGAVRYSNPSRELLVLAVTGTKGKSSTTEMLNAIFEEAGKKTVLLNSIRIKIGGRSDPNTMRMSMPGRFFIQRFLSEAHREGCAVAILEMTSEGARQHRQRDIELDGLIFTNLAPEHIESHGSFEAYASAKFEIGKQLGRSRKRPRVIVANADDDESARYLELPVEVSLPFSLSANPPWFSDERGGYFTLDGVKIPVHSPGEFSLKNALGAATLARAFGIEVRTIARALDKLKHIPGRAELVEGGQDFAVVVDYAHTPDSLEALYEAYGGRRKICVMGATGGGRDTWKRPIMGVIADERCDAVILTNEDPYDENPEEIMRQLARDMKRKPELIVDRRAAIARGIKLARAGDAVLITGKGTDPCICGPNGSKTPWSDAAVAREEIARHLHASGI
jgi:UDP-N-acetylmuramoyl-L-alanyl-D-glutamate--2,6-diaminopimelate ligase